eukprot:CAMPEP_0119115422 /NCGR_PEP_ID=MMETSP1180-20130426/50921_1 /TAXON_ID=3052 ORGANISM="Chlamydomonas cf sp, Strain CCMP681" /NCGR_SAMPLE_ID=MMETSP1180 /ASSEMBLY_ACC=CAM_ASM_000741 /LENGTH=123 /DNA_ID=CAMNT_0007104387 /DNA_START=185 /DNA_END=556 /DNA_ORIENTATION=+
MSRAHCPDVLGPLAQRCTENYSTTQRAPTKGGFSPFRVQVNTAVPIDTWAVMPDSTKLPFCSTWTFEEVDTGITLCTTLIVTLSVLQSKSESGSSGTPWSWHVEPGPNMGPALQTLSQLERSV